MPCAPATPPSACSATRRTRRLAALAITAATLTLSACALSPGTGSTPARLNHLTVGALPIVDDVPVCPPGSAR
jgi:hypothetical protein